MPRSSRPVARGDQVLVRTPSSNRDGQTDATHAASVVPRRALFDLLSASVAGGVAVISAPPGSGKTILLRSWVADGGLSNRVAWVSVRRGEMDPQHFWTGLVGALRATVAGSKLVGPLSAAPSFDGWALVERLIGDLSSLKEPLWIVLDDLHELRSDEGLRQLELLLLRAPETVRLALSTRHDLRMGLHRLRLEGRLTEIRLDDLRFTLDQARELFESAGVRVSAAVLAKLVERTEGWVAGLRLAALTLARHPDPDRFAAEFSGSERTVAEYLLAEVLERQPDDARRLLLRTSILEQVSGPLADALTGSTGGERILQQLEDENAFVVSVDSSRAWFRFHHLFADLLQLELRRTEPDEIRRMHAIAAGWHDEHGYPVRAIRHAQAAEDWGLASRLLSEHWLRFYLGGQAAVSHELLSRFPARSVADDAELAALSAADELNRGSLQDAERYLIRAAQHVASVPEERRGRFQVMLAWLRLTMARQRGNLPAVIEEAEKLLALAGTPDATQLGPAEDLRSLALISLGMAEYSSLHSDAAERHLGEGLTLARRIEQPYLAVGALGYLALAAGYHSSAMQEKWSAEAIELANQHGWSEEPVAAIACVARAAPLIWSARIDEAEPLLDRAQRGLRAETEPSMGWLLQLNRGLLEVARQRDDEALAAFQEAERLAELLIPGHPLVPTIRALRVHVLVRKGDVGGADAALVGLRADERATPRIQVALAALRLAQGDPAGATDTLGPIVNGTAPSQHQIGVAIALLVEAKARDALGEPAAAEQALERALDIAESEALLWPFLLHPLPELLEHHRRSRTAHGAVVANILDLLAGGGAAPRGERERLLEPLTESEMRVLRYLPTHLSAPEIGTEIYLSANTVKTHMRHVYEKLGVHSRIEAVGRARDLGLLAPSLHRR